MGCCGSHEAKFRWWLWGYLTTMLLSALVTIVMCFIVYGIFLGRNTEDVAHSNSNQSLAANVFFISCDGLLLVLCLLELLAIFGMFWNECRIPKYLETDSEVKYQHIITQRASIVVRYAVAHSVVLLVAVIVDFVIDSDIWVDIPLLGVVLLQIFNSLLLYLMKSVVKNIRYERLQPPGSNPKPRLYYAGYFSLFMASCLVEIVFCCILYIYFIQRNARDLDGDNTIQSKELNIAFLVLDSITLHLVLFEILLLLMMLIVHCVKICDKDLAGIQNGWAWGILWCNIAVTSIHAALLLAVLIMDAVVNYEDLLIDLPLFALVLTNLLYLSSFAFLWKVLTSAQNVMVRGGEHK